ncbi:tagaturonate reductase [soil metagenome]
MQLSKQNISQIQNKNIVVPAAEIFSLPEKVLQFGTGVLLRGLCDYFIDKANKQNIFNGRIVVVKSTSQGDTDAFALQDGLYTQLVKGIEDRKAIEETIINASISRVLSAKDEWKAILKCAANTEMQVIISNTTEVGITYTEESIASEVPSSFPGKLLAWLYERYKVFNGSGHAGMIIIPTELLTDNAGKLKAIVIKLAQYNKLEESFINWLQTANHFCSSLVDRIVPGKVSASESDLGYADDLILMSEVYRLWAIETNDQKVMDALSFAQTDSGVVLAADIYKYRELKIRLLNGPHTLSCGLAVLAGFATVKEAMADKDFRNYITQLMLREIADAIADEQISYEEAKLYVHKVIDRFSNPYLEHKWLSICLQYSSKMLMRNIPILQKHYAKINAVPSLMAIGFAAYILFMKSEQNERGEFMGKANNIIYTINDDKAAQLHQHWQKGNLEMVVQNILANETLWSTDLNQLPGFAEAVIKNIKAINNTGAKKLIQSIS